MGLSFDYDRDWHDSERFFYPPDNYSILATKRRRRCCSCNYLIDVGSEVLKFERGRFIRSDIEENIYGHLELVPLASWYMCKECGDLYYYLDGLGFCFYLPESMKSLVQKYRDMDNEQNNMKERY